MVPPCPEPRFSRAARDSGQVGSEAAEQGGVPRVREDVARLGERDPAGGVDLVPVLELARRPAP